MSAQILRKRRIFAIRRLALAAIGVSFFVLSGTTLAADIGIANPSAVAAALGGRRRLRAYRRRARVANTTRYLRWTALEVLPPLKAAPPLRHAPADNGRPARLEPLR